MTPSHIITRVKESTDLIALVGQYADMRKSGAQFLVRCPWHDDHEPSCRVYPDGHLFCFTCNTTADCFTFLQRVEGISFPEALKRLADRAGIPLDQKPISRVAMAYAREEAAFCRWWWERKLARLTAQGLADWTDEMDLEMCDLVTVPLARVLALTIPERFAEFRARATEADRREWRTEVAEERDFTEAWMRLASI